MLTPKSPLFRAALSLLILASTGFASVSCSALKPPGIYFGGSPVLGSDGNPIVFTENPDAVDPSYEELMVFLKSDSTESHTYVDSKGQGGYRCTEFARDLHDNAEAFGIKCGFVGITFAGDGIGHAIDAIKTTDKGLVYVDCTGGTTYENAEFPEATHNPDLLIAGRHDTIAYVVVGKPYGCIGIDYAKSLTYDFYTQYSQRWDYCRQLSDEYSSAVDQYNRDIAGKTFYVGTPQWTAIKAREAALKQQQEELDSLQLELGDGWFEPLGMVQHIFVHW